VSRLDRAAIIASLEQRVGAGPDPEGLADLLAPMGRINVVASVSDADAAIARLKPLGGYRWIAINGGDLFGLQHKTMGAKVGIVDATGKVLKAADLPRPR
jgi:hypothetical protein